MKHYSGNGGGVMNQFTRSSILAGIAVGLLMPGVSFSGPVTPADKPLFQAAGVKSNVLLAIDDSGSMDFETLFPTNDASLWLNSDGSFVNVDGSFQDKDGSLGGSGKYTYLFPNGQNGNYDGSMMLGNNHYAIPPLKPFAFARSAEYNRAFYDPSEDYEPWPSYGGFTFNDSNPTDALVDPMETATLDLTANIDTSTKGWQWDFDINDADMPCTDDGGPCGSEQNLDVTYYPATYYVVDTDSSYTFTPKGDSMVFDAEKSVLMEAEDAVISGNYTVASEDSAVEDANLIDTASNNDYVGIEGVSNSMKSPPSNGELQFEFSVAETGTQAIWIRKRMPDGGSDSAWINLLGFDQAQVTIPATSPQGSWFTLAGEDWHEWRDGHTHQPNWHWELWGLVDINTTSSQTMRIRYREMGTYIDQVLVTSNTSATPVGPVALFDNPIDCGAGGSPAYYKEFESDTTQFSGVDAIGPDGQCLDRVEIKASQSNYHSGESYSRTYDEEIQNFANWFTYYRRRHQAMRGGLGSAFEGVGGIRTGIFWINDRSNVTMYDMDDSTDVTSFLDDHYNHVETGGTPLRSALDHAGEQYTRTDSGAPITEACQQNYTMLFTDGFANANRIRGINNEDGDAGEPYEDSYSDTLGDIAFKYYEDNPRPNLEKGLVRTPGVCEDSDTPASVDCNSDLHMNTYTVGLGAEGTLFGVTHNKVIDAYDNPPNWPDVSNVRDKRQVDDLYHAAVNGRGEIFNARSPAELRTELSTALREIIASIGNASAVTFNTGTLSAESLVFSSFFNSTTWTGDLEARPLDPANGDVLDPPAWTAADQLENQSPSDRVIITYNDDDGDGVPFQWSELDGGQKDDLNTAPNGTQDGNGQSRLAYLRGDRSEEGVSLRTRGAVLGDIVHSTPVFVGDPQLNWPDEEPFSPVSTPYSNFKSNTAQGRTPVVYAGANDGMLHGFNALEDTSEGGGDEILAYIPRSVYSDAENEGLHYLTDPDYSHRFYVDLSPQAVDVHIATEPNGTASWRTVLIGGLRNGGPGLFALDVTDPSEFSEGNAEDLALWEFDETDDERLNYFQHEPVVGMMNNGRWALIAGNGLANGSSAEDNKTGVFIIYLDEEAGLDGTWTEGADYEFIEMGDTGGMASVRTIDTNGDQIIDRLYGGDREGNLWAVDVSDSNSGKWESAFKDGNGSNANPEPLFVAEDASGNPQPINTAPLVLNNTLSSAGSEGPNGEDYLIYFGTGQYFTNGDSSDTSTQSFYGVWDRGDSTLDRDDLVEHEIETTDNLRNVDSSAIDWDSSTARDHGFFMDLPESGERVLEPPQFRGETLFFDTFTPSTDPCEGGGSAWLMSLTLDGSDPKNPVFDSNNDGVIDGNDDEYAGEKLEDGGTGGSRLLDNYQYKNKGEGGSGTDKREVDPGGSGNRTGRLGWQELDE